MNVFVISPVVRATTFNRKLFSRVTVEVFNANSLLFLLQSDLPFVEIYRAKKFTLRSPIAQNDTNISSSTQPIPLSNNSNSQWNCDGEVVHESDVTIK